MADRFDRFGVKPLLPIHDILAETITSWHHALYPTAVAENISRQCIDDSRLYVRSYERLDAWAVISETFVHFYSDYK